MAIELNPHEAPIRRGIRLVGIGQKGSQNLPVELADEIYHDLLANKVPPLAKGAFFGGLIMKGIAPEEEIVTALYGQRVMSSMEEFVDLLCEETPKAIKEQCVKLLEGKTLTFNEMYDIGSFLFSSFPGDVARGLIVSVLRVRYETLDEYAGLLRSMKDQIREPFCGEFSCKKPLVQIAEPFDGAERSYLMTPLISYYLQERNYCPIALVGRSGGPKKGNTLAQLATSIKGDFLKSIQDLSQDAPLYGWFLHQKDLAPSVDVWVDFRREIIKRPFLATLERFFSPFKARISITSAFHPPYGEKMTDIAEIAGHEGSIVVRNGLEGGLSFALKREVKMLCSAKRADGRYRRHEIVFNPVEFLGEEVVIDEKLKEPSLVENAGLVDAYRKHQNTFDEMFNLRARATLAGIGQAVDWVEQNIGS